MTVPDKNLLAYCGLYCGDCAGHTGVIADAAEALKKATDEYKFDRAARELFPDELVDYDKFAEMLGFIAGLRCAVPCRDKAEGETECAIRKCCIERGYFACNECAEFAGCDKFDRMTALHGDSCARNLAAINETGLEEWLKSGKRYWFGDE
ncbi:MAG: DUF3795 domain-containing protein [bacterium]|nr:DUF3795 domain-containing protein [bacterium]